MRLVRLRRTSRHLCCAVAVLAGGLLAAGCSNQELPPEAQTHVNAAETYFREGKLQDTLREFEAALQSAPRSHDLRLRIAGVHAALGHHEDAIRQIREVLDEDPNSAAAYEEWGIALARQQRMDEAVRKWEVASDLDPTRVSVMMRLAVTLVNLRRFGDAVGAFDRLAKIQPDPSAEVLLNWGSALHNMNRPEEARAKFEAAVEKAPEHPLALNNLGVLLTKSDTDRARGIEMLERALRIKPADPLTLHNLGWAYLREERWSEAFNLIQRSLAATDPRHPIYESRKKDLAEAASHLPRSEATPEMPNILLIAIDTLRYDHLGLYGYPRNTSPNLDALARKGVVFEHAISQAPWTAASFGSLFTGLYPSVHGINGGVRWGPGQTSAGGTLPFAVQKTLSATQLTMAEALRRSGYSTAGFVSNVYINSIFGFSQGFELYNDRHEDYSKNVSGAKRRGENTNGFAFDWLRGEVKEPFFLFVHYNDPHWPYDPPQGIGKEWVKDYQGSLTPEKTTQVVQAEGKPITNLSPEDVQYMIGLYDGEIAYTDRNVGRLLHEVEQRGFKRPLLTVVTADHGEEFLDHGSASHGYTLYDEQIRVPLVFNYPERLKPRRVDAQVRLVDVLPTVLDLVGAPAIAGLQGESAAAHLRGGSTPVPRDAYSEAPYNKDMTSVRTDAGPKLIYDFGNRKAQLFDIRSDPREQKNLSESNGAEVTELNTKLETFRGANETIRVAREKEGGAASEVILDEATQERLRALGYIH